MVYEETDKWERLAIHPHVYAPLLIFLQQLFLILLADALLSSLFFIPLLLLSFYNLWMMFRVGKKFHMKNENYVLSIGIILLTLFFPYILLASGVGETEFAFLYLTTQLPIFFGHLYSAIFFTLRAQAEPSIVIEE